MSLEENKALTRRWSEEIWGKGDQAAMDELLAADFTFHYPSGVMPPGVSSDLEGYKQWVSMGLASFSDISCQADDIVAEGDKVVARWTWKGKHTGEFMGVPPTGKQVAITGISIFRIADGKIVEEWGEQDNLGMMQQLGMLEQPG